jgi:uncharacterized membrane protein
MELILNHTTLFYYNISSTKTSKTKYGPVEDWLQDTTQVINKQLSNRDLSNIIFGQVAEAGLRADEPKHSSSHPLRRTASSTIAVTANRTTSSSNAVVISSKSKISNQGSKLQDAGPSQGFLEEDEDEERNAALSSPIKGGKRLSSAVRYTLFISNIF